MLNPQQKKIIYYLANGLKAGQVANILGVTAGYISQLQGDGKPLGWDEEMERAVAEAGSREDSADEVLSNKYLSAESKALKAVEDGLAYAEFPQLVNALKVLGERQEKRAARKAGLLMAGAGQGQVVNVVNLVLPSHSVPEYQINPQGQVLAIGGKEMNPLPSAGVRELFNAIKDKKEMARLEQVKGSIEVQDDGQGAFDL